MTDSIETTESDALPWTPPDAPVSTPAAMWRADGEPDPHAGHYDGERATLTLGNMTDDELANGAFMNYDQRLSVQDMLNPRPGQHMPIVWMTAVKDRIRWLSRALERALATPNAPAETASTEACEVDAFFEHWVSDAPSDFRALAAQTA
jgi:hypothetical protein